MWWVTEEASGEITGKKDEEWEAVLQRAGAWDRDLVSLGFRVEVLGLWV